MEKMFYEIRPALFLAASLYALHSSQQSALMKASGWLLMACVLLILFARYVYRKA